MAISYKSLKNNIDKINSNLKYQDREVFGKIQKAYSSPHILFLGVRTPGKTNYLCIGRGGDYSGLWEGERFPNSKIRVIDRFLEYFRKYIVSGSLLSLEVSDKDKLVKLNYVKGKPGVLTLFWRGKDLYFSNIYTEGSGIVCFTSWSGKIKGNWQNIDDCWKDFELKLSEIDYGKLEIGEKKEQKDGFDLDKYEERLLKGSKKIENRKKKSIKRKIKNIEQDLEKVLKWSDLENVVNNYETEIPSSYKSIICGVKFKFESNLNDWGRRNLIFEKIKRFKKAQVLLQERLENTKVELQRIADGDLDYEVKLPESIDPVWITHKSKKTIVEADKKIDTFVLQSGKVLGVGNKDIANDYLRSKWAGKNDLWFHIDGYPSAHLIVKTDSFNSLTMDEIAIIGSILIEYSSLSIQESPLMYTLVKNLKGIKGQKGGVIMKKQKYITVPFLSDWRQRISSFSD